MPKRAGSAATLFFHENAHLAKDFAPTHRLRVLHQKFQELDEGAREEYKRRADEQRVQRKQQMEQWKAEHLPPKRPASSYARFVREFVAETRSNGSTTATATELMRQAATQWRTFSQSKKV